MDVEKAINALEEHIRTCHMKIEKVGEELQSAEKIVLGDEAQAKAIEFLEVSAKVRQDYQNVIKDFTEVQEAYKDLRNSTLTELRELQRQCDMLKIAANKNDRYN